MSQSVMVIGLGRMGFALARQLLAGGFNVSVWNRTASKAAPLVEAGASQAADVASGIAASEVIVICVGTYDDSYEVLADCGDLSGKILLQLTSASAEDALGMAQWAAERGARYLDGFIAAFPQDIGTPKCPLHIAGEAEAWETVEDAVMCLGGASDYIGENVAAGAVLDQANILFGLTSSLAYIHGARMAESVGLDVGDYADAMVNAVAHQLAPQYRHYARCIASGNFDETAAAIGTWKATMEGLVDDSNRGTPAVALLEGILAQLGHAIEAGDGDRDLSAVIKLLRSA